jgi:type III secretory pathway component EscT
MDRLVAELGGEDAILRWLVVGALVAARVAPLTIFAPWLALRSTPPVLRAALIVALTVSLTPIAIESAPAIAPGGLELALLSVREALVGTTFALATALPLYALDWAGRLVDTWRGASLAEVINPHTGERTSPIGDLYLLMGVVLFLSLGGHRVAIEAFAGALETIPVGTGDVAGGAETVAMGALRLFGNALAFAAALAAPAAAAIVLVEAALGLVARAAPQIPVFFAGMPLRAAVGIAAALLGLSILVGELPAAYRGALESAEELVAPFAEPGGP